MTPDSFRVVALAVDDARPYSNCGAYLLRGEQVLPFIGHSKIGDAGEVSGRNGIRYQMIIRKLAGDNERIDYPPGDKVQLLVPINADI